MTNLSKRWGVTKLTQGTVLNCSRLITVLHCSRLIKGNDSRGFRRVETHGDPMKFQLNNDRLPFAHRRVVKDRLIVEAGPCFSDEAMSFRQPSARSRQAGHEPQPWPQSCLARSPR